MESEKQKANSEVNQGYVAGTGPVTLGRNRERLTLATTYAEATNLVSWLKSANIREAICIVTADDSRSTAVAADVPDPNDNYVLVAINGINETIEKAMLTEVDSEDSDVQHEKFLIGERFKITLSLLESKGPLERLAFLPVNASGTLSNIKVLIGAH